MVQLGQRTDKADWWRSSDQTQRWVAAAFLDIETCLRRIKGYRHLPLLRAAVQHQIALSTQHHEYVALQTWEAASEFQRTMGLTPRRREK